MNPPSEASPISKLSTTGKEISVRLYPEAVVRDVRTVYRLWHPRVGMSFDHVSRADSSLLALLGGTASEAGGMSQSLRRTSAASSPSAGTPATVVTMAPCFLRRRDAARVLAVSESQLLVWERAGRLHPVRLPDCRAIRYARAEIEAFARFVIEAGHGVSDAEDTTQNGADSTEAADDSLTRSAHNAAHREPS